MDAAHMAAHTCNTLQLQLAISHVSSDSPIVTLPVFDRGGVLDVTCESLSCLSRRPGTPPSGRPRTRDPLACAGDSRDRERESQSMVDALTFTLGWSHTRIPESESYDRL